jgi:hypothetical protein
MKIDQHLGTAHTASAPQKLASSIARAATDNSNAAEALTRVICHADRYYHITWLRASSSRKAAAGSYGLPCIPGNTFRSGQSPSRSRASSRRRRRGMSWLSLPHPDRTCRRSPTARHVAARNGTASSETICPRLGRIERALVVYGLDATVSRSETAGLGFASKGHSASKLDALPIKSFHALASSCS